MDRTPLQEFAECIAADVRGTSVSECKAGVDAGVVEWIALVEMIMEMVMKFVEQCQQRKQQLVQTVKQPSRFEKVYFRNLVISNWDDRRGWGWRREARQVADTLLTSASTQSDEALQAMIDQCHAALGTES
jgi:hypothetical protein